MKIRPIETSYAGYRFRSRTEARWAVFFDTLGITWEYEPQGYVLDGRPYLPDFKLVLPRARVVFAEVKNIEIDRFEGEHLQLCRTLADGLGCEVVLLAGHPGYSLHNMVTPSLPSNHFQAVFFIDYGEKLRIADDYWFGQAELDHDTGRLLFRHDDRAAEKSFGRGVVEAVRAARSARF
ncbi:hypothetical protein [Nocardia cyriacigeorgica]|uniref:hypothetical protein n=1 Tax=Nocardia cyriacigeorgica TaxID=135487 RepID=UPI002455554A|nr:hypothetical protein [Nocardia cyriacigeorgica]